MFSRVLRVSVLAAIPCLSIAAQAASPDCYAVNFRNSSDAKSVSLDASLSTALAMTGMNIEEVVIDTSTAAKWEKGAHEAFDRDIVPVFNKWVGLPGFAAIVDARTKRVIGCVNSLYDAAEMADEIKQMCSKASGAAYMSRAGYDYTSAPRTSLIWKTSGRKTTQCPAAHNVDVGE